jgi:hypothetical protein
MAFAMRQQPRSGSLARAHAQTPRCHTHPCRLGVAVALVLEGALVGGLVRRVLWRRARTLRLTRGRRRGGRLGGAALLTLRSMRGGRGGGAKSAARSWLRAEKGFWRGVARMRKACRVRVARACSRPSRTARSAPLAIASAERSSAPACALRARGQDERRSKVVASQRLSHTPNAIAAGPSIRASASASLACARACTPLARANAPCVRRRAPPSQPCMRGCPQRRLLGGLWRPFRARRAPSRAASADRWRTCLLQTAAGELRRDGSDGRGRRCGCISHGRPRQLSAAAVAHSSAARGRGARLTG